MLLPSSDICEELCLTKSGRPPEHCTRVNPQDTWEECIGRHLRHVTAARGMEKALDINTIVNYLQEQPEEFKTRFQDMLSRSQGTCSWQCCPTSADGMPSRACETSPIQDGSGASHNQPDNSRRTRPIHTPNSGEKRQRIRPPAQLRDTSLSPGLAPRSRIQHSQAAKKGAPTTRLNLSELQYIEDHKIVQTGDSKHIELLCRFLHKDKSWVLESQLQQASNAAVCTYWGCGPGDWKRPGPDMVPPEPLKVLTYREADKSVRLQMVGYPVSEGQWMPVDDVKAQWGAFLDQRCVEMRPPLERAMPDPPSSEPGERGELQTIVGHRVGEDDGDGYPDFQLSCQWTSGPETWEYDYTMQRAYNAAVLTYWHSDPKARKCDEVPARYLQFLSHDPDWQMLEVQWLGYSACADEVRWVSFAEAKKFWPAGFEQYAKEQSVPVKSYRKHAKLPHEARCGSHSVVKGRARHQGENAVHRKKGKTPPDAANKDEKPNRRRKDRDQIRVSAVDQRSLQATMIWRKLEECRNKLANSEARWLGKMEVLGRMFPNDEAIKFAEIGTTPFSSDCDVLSLSDDGLEQLLRRGEPLTVPILRKATQKPGYPDEDLTEELVDRFGRDAWVNVGDPSSTGRNPTQMRVRDVVAAMKGTKPLSGGLPFTLLDLKLLARVSPIPNFLNCRRFWVIDRISDRLASEMGGAGKPRIEQEVDLASSKASSLWAQDGGFTGMHTDLLPGWVHVPRQSSANGFKVWILPARDATQADFEEQGEDWAPEVRVLILEPGDCLVMPTPTPHAVFTVGDTWMHHGTFIDLHNIPAWLDSLIRIAKNPDITNEPIPIQLISGWHHLQALFSEHVQDGITNGTITEEEGKRLEADFIDRDRRLRNLLSCACSGSCRKDCRCKKSAAFDHQCNPWCLNMKRKKRKRGL